MSYYKRKFFIKKFDKKYGLETSSRSFRIHEKLSTDSVEKSIFWNKVIALDM